MVEGSWKVATAPREFGQEPSGTALAGDVGRLGPSSGRSIRRIGNRVPSATDVSDPGELGIDVGAVAKPGGPWLLEGELPEARLTQDNALLPPYGLLEARLLPSWTREGEEEIR
jgi:hypothetical protein